MLDLAMNTNINTVHVKNGIPKNQSVQNSYECSVQTVTP
jgi:hypothetical protein